MNMKIPSAEEEVVFYHWHILNKIKKASLLSSTGNSTITYTVFLHPQSKDLRIPNSTTEQKILQKFIDDNIVAENEESSSFQIGEDKVGNPKSAGANFYLKVNQDKFGKLFNRYKKLVKQIELSEEKGNTLTFNINGDVAYTSLEGTVYKTRFKKGTNNYEVLSFLVKNPHQVLSFDVIADHLKAARGDVDYSDNERRVRDTVRAIKNKLGYKKKEGLFISQQGYGLDCNVMVVK